MDQPRVVCLQGLVLEVPDDPRPLGTRVLQGLAELAERALVALAAQYAGHPIALVSRMRGTGRGVSLTSVLGAIDRDHPLEVRHPFEGSERVGGAVWIPADLGIASSASVAKLRWSAHASDLPMHVHEHSDRFIIVRSGRGYFHVTDESADGFTGTRVRSIPARERDVFLFTRGVVHTFSTDAEPMELLSCQLPYISFDDPRQFRLPSVSWTANEPESYRAEIRCDAAWDSLIR